MKEYDGYKCYTEEEIQDRVRTQLRHMGLEGLIEWVMNRWERDNQARDTKLGDELKALQKSIVAKAGLKVCPVCHRPMNDGEKAESLVHQSRGETNNVPVPEKKGSNYPASAEPRFTQPDEEIAEWLKE